MPWQSVRAPERGPVDSTGDWQRKNAAPCADAVWPLRLPFVWSCSRRAGSGADQIWPRRFLHADSAIAHRDVIRLSRSVLGNVASSNVLGIPCGKAKTM